MKKLGSRMRPAGRRLSMAALDCLCLEYGACSMHHEGTGFDFPGDYFCFLYFLSNIIYWKFSVFFFLPIFQTVKVLKVLRNSQRQIQETSKVPNSSVCDIVSRSYILLVSANLEILLANRKKYQVNIPFLILDQSGMCSII